MISGAFVEVLIGGLLSGVLYALVAIGFVLIFKASGVFNYAQGAIMLFGTLTFVVSLDLAASYGLLFWPSFVLAFLSASAFLVVTAWAIPRFAFRKLANKDSLILFMATIGVAYILQGLSQLAFGAGAYSLKIFPNDALIVGEDWFDGGVLLNSLDLIGGLIAAVLVVLLASFFRYTTIGRALRAVASDHLAALSIGIPLAWIWFVVWLAAALVGLIAGLIWGSKIGVQFAITFLALKALPVLIIGGFDSIVGAIVGGLMIGAAEKLAEMYLGPIIGGGVEYWFAYVVALVVLLVRPQGLFGQRVVQRI